jgi:MinD-like ATPase involved in chromosome partitioning or flagellar assembly
MRKATRFLLFTGKGGVGKTTLAAATAVALAEEGGRVLLASTNPASNLDDVLATVSGSTWHRLLRGKRAKQCKALARAGHHLLAGSRRFIVRSDFSCRLHECGRANPASQDHCH